MTLEDAAKHHNFSCQYFPGNIKCSHSLTLRPLKQIDNRKATVKDLLEEANKHQVVNRDGNGDLRFKSIGH